MNMKKATLTISKMTDRKNGYGMPIVEVISDNAIEIINRGWNEFEAVNEIDESELRQLYNNHFVCMQSDRMVMLEITTPKNKVNCWYNVPAQLSFSEIHASSNIIW